MAGAVKTRGVEVVGQMTDLELSQFAWALATLGIKKHKVPFVYLNNLSMRADPLSSIHVSMATHLLVLMGNVTDVFFVDRCLRRLLRARLSLETTPTGSSWETCSILIERVGDGCQRKQRKGHLVVSVAFIIGLHDWQMFSCGSGGIKF